MSQSYGSFKASAAFNIKYAPISLSKYRSTRTGLTVVIGNHASPITNGHFIIRSEIFDDTGRPHTLEHLIFLGSRDYPYKGVLDQLANRAGSNGTNAWTDTDHTAYTISTAGSDGFLRMLPVYVDHILHPIIADCGYVTEVHHINGKGEDAGVVYSEMQGRENTSGDLMSLANQRALYPLTSAYRSETGGLTPALRVLDAQQIREYHASYYTPHNLCLLIDGAINLDDLFAVLNKIDAGLTPSNNPRPFTESTTAQPLTLKPTTTTVPFMEEDESVGEIWMTWLGPPPMNYRTNLALKLLGSYLTHSSASPLKKEFVEIPKPYATSIGFYASDRVNQNELTCCISDVPTRHLDAIPGMLRSTLSSHTIDMERMALILRRDKRKLLNSMETSVSSVLSDVVIGDFLYGGDEDLPSAFEDLADYQALSSWTSADWSKLLAYYTAPCIAVIGKPSAEMSNQVETDERDRIAKRLPTLDLPSLESALAAAKAESDTPPPPSMIADFPITDPSTLQWVPVKTHTDLAHYAQVDSNFITVTALFDTARLPHHLYKYMSLYEATLFSVGVKHDGKQLDHEQVANALNNFTVSQSAYFSFRGCFSETLVIQLKVEKAQSAEALNWLRDVVSEAVFEASRLNVLIAKQLQELPYEKRQGASIARAYANRLVFSDSPSENCSLLYLLENTLQIAEELESNPDAVVSALNEIKTYLLDPSILRVSIAGNVTSLPLDSFLPISRSPSPLATSASTLTPLASKPNQRLILTPMPAIEGSYSHHYSLGARGWDHPDLPALNLANAMLNATESYLYKAVRGSGLAYGVNTEVDIESGLVGFNVYRSPNAMLAYEEAGKLVRALADGSTPLDQATVDGARSSLTYEYARKSETVMAAASTAYLNELKGLPKDHDQEMLKKLPLVTLDQLRRVIQTYFLPLFSADTSVGAVSVSTGKAEEVEKGFAGLGFKVERRELPMLGGDSDSESGSGSGSGSGSDSEIDME